MSKTKTVTKITEIISQVAPELQFAAVYNSDDPQLAGSTKLYQNRCFVYVLTLQVKGKEACIYVGETRLQYARFLQHKANFAFDRIYLYECDEGVLRMCEAAVIRRLTPLFNKSNNPLHSRFNRVLGVDNIKSNDREAVIRCLESWYEYCDTGLYGFALPPVIYGLLKADALAHKSTVSEELTALLEACYTENIAAELRETASDNSRSNLLTTREYSELHGKSTEQIKQYLHQEGRLTGKRFGRDWVIIDDEKFPEDRRKKDANF